MKLPIRARDEKSRDLAEDFATLFAELRLRGYRRIGLAMNPDDELRRRWALLSPYLLFQHQNPALPRLRPMEDAVPYPESGLFRWMKTERPDVVVVNGGEPLDWLHAGGLTAPDDVGLCRIDCVENRPESGLRADYFDMGRHAVSQIATSLERNELGPPATRPVVSLPNRWHEGTTLRSRQG